MTVRGIAALVLAVGMVWGLAGAALGADGGGAGGAAGGVLRERVAALTAGKANRSAGSAGAKANADYIAAEAQRLTRRNVERQSFLLVLPVVERCRGVDRTDGAMGAEVPLSPLLPSGSQPASLPDDPGGSGATAEVMYVGNGTLQELRGKDLRRQFVAIDAASGPLAWKTAASLGARAVLFLGDTQTRAADLLNKSSDIPVGIPRFYCDDAGAVGRIRSGALKSMTIDVRMRWEEKTLENLFCFLPGTLNPDKYVVLQARYDGSSLITGRCPGATQACSAAALLELAGTIAARAEHTSVLLVWTAGDEWNFRGTRAALDLLNADFKDARHAVLDLDQNVRTVEGRLALVQRVAGGLPGIAAGTTDLGLPANAELRKAIGDQLLRESSRIEDALEHARLQPTPDTAQIDSLQSQKDDLNRATGALSGKSPEGWKHPRIAAAAAALLPQWTTEVDRLTALRTSLAGWPTIRSELGDRTPMLFASLVLSSGSPRFGFFARSYYAPILDSTALMGGFAFRRYVHPVVGPVQEGFVGESMENTYTLETFFSKHVAFCSDAALMRGSPGGAFATIQDASEFLDTPNDTLNRLDLSNLYKQEQSLEELLVGSRTAPGALVDAKFTDTRFGSRAPMPRYVADQDVTLYERAVGESLPRLKAANCLIGGQSMWFNRPLGTLAGTRRFDWYLTYVDGTTRFASCFRADNTTTQLQASDFDDFGQPLRTLAGNQADVHGMVSDFFPDADRPVRALLFESRRLDCYGLFDPRYLDMPDRIDVYDARRTDKAPYSQVYAEGDMAAVFMPPDLRWQLLVAKGALANRMLLINADSQHPTGQGFDTTDLGEIGPLAWRNDLDLAALNGRRQSDLEKFGISNEVIKELQEAASQQMDEAREAQKTRDYPAFFAGAQGAWSLQSQVYENLIDTSNGIIKGVIFLLLGIIPFSYFLERLLIGSPNVYRQIAGFAAIFVLMTAALWFHPAFRISSAPLMILLAFLILILSSAVVYILWGKFEEEIAILRGAATAGGAAHSTSLRRAAVLGAAIRLGLSNMRRRGTRTGLTLLTLVLLTFTLLCFTSVRESVQITPRVVDFPADLGKPPPGVLLRQRGWTTLPQETVSLARELSLPEGGPIARRWWYASEKVEQTWSLPVRVEGPNGTGEIFYTNGLLGLDPSETAFQATPMDAVLPGFSKMAEDSQICWLPDEARKTGTLAVGDTVEILGHPLTIAGFFDDASFRKLRQLTGDPLSPLRPASTGGSAGASAEAQANAATETHYQFMQSATIAVVPAKFVERLGGRLSSVMFRPSVALDSMLKYAEDLARRSAFSVYVSDGTRVRSINASAGSQPKDFSAVLVPMIIAGVIILNTMLGAVAERTREIHVYTSIGLAPSHVGMLFLAEAAALGTIGVVSGYIFGQGLATVLTWTHLLPGVDLNYSSLSAIVTMGLVLGLVMLSALWPARAATRVAAPSLQREWKLPKPVGDILSVELPFTVNEAAAKGVCAFIEEFFVTATQTGTARFTADNIHAFLRPGEADTTIRGLQARIWLAPYDLGVIEMIRLTIHPTGQHNIFDVRLEITREAGNPGSWQRLNRPFLTEVRKQFLLWRNLTPEQIKHYVERSEKLFERARQT